MSAAKPPNMLMAQYIASVILLMFGGLLAAVNARILVCQLRGKHSPSATPILGGLFLFIGCLLFPNGALWPWAVFGPFLDYGCMPYLIFASVYLICEKLRHAHKNEILALRYHAPRASGVFTLYPNDECIRKWSAADGLSSGSMIMKIDEYIPDRLIRLSLQAIRLSFEKSGQHWNLVHEEGWDDSMHSLELSTISEQVANKVAHRTR
jgi:hypothetical protein